jgi:hypothetical protein
MSWDDYRQRRDALTSVLGYAAAHPSAGLPFDELPGVAAVFADRQELLLALQYDWSQALWARIELLSLDTKLGDASALAQAAWAQCAEQHPVLRRLLDAHQAELGHSTRREREMMNSPFVA